MEKFWLKTKSFKSDKMPIFLVSSDHEIKDEMRGTIAKSAGLIG